MISAVLKSPRVEHVSSPVVLVRGIKEEQSFFWTIGPKVMAPENIESRQLMRAMSGDLLQRKEKAQHRHHMVAHHRSLLPSTGSQIPPLGYSPLPPAQYIASKF
jgi:hypothetical protein